MALHMPVTNLSRKMDPTNASDKLILQRWGLQMPVTNWTCKDWAYRCQYSAILIYKRQWKIGLTKTNNNDNILFMAPHLARVRSTYKGLQMRSFLCLSVSLSVCLSLSLCCSLSVTVSLCLLSVCLFLSLSHTHAPPPPPPHYKYMLVTGW